ncbi:ABC transporter substrate-binding protein [Paenibacillus naphthalenovorans]|uniref:Glycerol-3-phosphate ABC transporter substrate-binding protein n=1 Tax=Paenibacillus naphthalenovorans TaxID=162209 RepID=A0A0U2M7A6_9BACL|nr:ABC transporter substrate-binding protein [Paenibacillus naphthalenovorans]ALS24000.1 glycerol-3-phosphate ABC transporter substrate-binding protein [Paenibacillus naphthalenovorans]
MKMKKWMTAMAAGTLAASLAACSGGTTTEGTAQADDGLKDDTTPVTIQYWHSHAEAQMEGLNYMVAEFSKKYPHITVEPVFQGAYAELHKKLQAAVAAGDVPAVTNVEVSSLPNFANSGVFADLTPWIQRDKVQLDDFSKGMLQAYAYNNKQYGFPLIVSTSVFVYNKTLLDQLGVQPPQTWSDIDAFNEKVTQKENGKTVRYAFSVPGWDTWYYDPWLVNGGGTILTSDMKKSAVETPESLRYIEKFYKWKNEGHMHIGYGKGASDNMRQMFLNGQIAMVQHTSAMLKMYRENAGFEVGVSFLPGDKQRTSNIGGAGIVMMEQEDAKKKEAAWKFIEFMTSSEHNIKWAESVGYLPTRKSAISSNEGSEYFKRWPQYKAVFDNFDSVTPRLQHPAYPEFSKQYLEVMGKMALNNEDPVPLMKEAANKINDILADFE